MKYLGLDVHDKATVFCLLEADGTEAEHGRVPTSCEALQQLVKRLGGAQEVTVGQEVGALSYFIHDAVTATGAKILSFNAYQMRMIASSRKKTDRRDAYWIAKALQSGMMPHPVYIPTGVVRRLRALLSQRDAIVTERKRWLLRARSYLRAGGYAMPKASRSVQRLLALSVGAADGLDAHLAQALELCLRNESSLRQELRDVEKRIRIETQEVPAIERLKTIPAVGDQVAVRIYAWVGDVSRFANARQLSSYAGLAPAVWQSGETCRHGGVTKQGSPPLRSVLVQAGHVLLFRCTDPSAAPLRAIAMRVHKTRAKRKIAVVAAARHILRIAFYVLRDQKDYDPALLHSESIEDKQAVA
jgi:transposase